MASGNQDAESRHYTTVQGATRNAVARYVVWKMLKTLFIKMRVMNLAELLLWSNLLRFLERWQWVVSVQVAVRRAATRRRVFWRYHRDGRMYFTLERHRRNKSVLSNSNCQVSSFRLPTLWQKALRLYDMNDKMLPLFFINPKSQLFKYQTSEKGKRWVWRHDHDASPGYNDVSYFTAKQGEYFLSGCSFILQDISD